MAARAQLLAAGHARSTRRRRSCTFVNTCAITSEAEAKSRQSVRRSLAHAREVYVAGCAANLRRRRQFAADRSPRASARSAPPSERRRLQMRPRPARAPTSSTACLSASAPRSSPAASPAMRRTRGFVKVQDGCDCHCSYCVIPSVRGDARSRRRRARCSRRSRRRVAGGQPEMVMTGISVGDYRDPRAGPGARRADASRSRGWTGVERVRLSSVEVIHVDDSLIDALRQRAEDLPAPAHPDAVRRRRGAGRDGAPLRQRAVSRARRGAAGRAAPQREHHDRCDRRLPDRGRGARSSARWR